MVEFIEKNNYIQSFNNLHINCNNKKLKDLVKNEIMKDFLKRYSESSIKTKISTYSSGLKYKTNMLRMKQ